MYYVDDTQWAKFLGKRCKARLAPNQGSALYGRCELKPHGTETMHLLERGMIWVWFSNPEHVEFTQPEYRRVEE